MSRSVCWTKAATSIASIAALNHFCLNSTKDNSKGDRNSTRCDELASYSSNANDSKEGTKLLFLGSGSSTGCPKPLCAILFGEGSNSFPRKKENDEEKDDEYLLQLERLFKNCSVSRLATYGDPKKNKNYRNNPSLLISHRNADDNIEDVRSGVARNVVIDTGKTFRESAIRFMPSNGITSLDAVVLTHEHMDAVGGMDDIRGFQLNRFRAGDSSLKQLAMPIYLSDQCYRSIANQYPYLIPKVVNDTEIVRHVAKLDFQKINPFQPFIAAGLKMTPLPVMHGEDFVSLGYAFSLRATKTASSSKEDKINVIYLSDISRMPEKTLEYLREHTPQPVHILVVDALLTGDKKNAVHYNLNEAIFMSRCLKAKKTYIVGMNCDDFLPHDDMNEKLKEDYDKGGVDIQLAYDGLVIDF